MAVLADLDIRKCTGYDEDGIAMMFSREIELKSGIHSANMRVVTTLKKTILLLSTFAVEARPGHFNALSLDAHIITKDSQLAIAETLCREGDWPKTRKARHAFQKAEWDKIPNSEKEDHRSSRSGDNKSQKSVLRLGRSQGPSHATQAKGDFDGAEGVHRRSLIIGEKMLGMAHPDVLFHIA